MRTTIDGAGRVVIPKAVRDEAGLHAGAELEVSFRDGHVELAPAVVPMRVIDDNGQPVVVSETEMPVLTTEEVRRVLERTRR
jgi:AbrB family looped-hinge helix DNA binding protein